MKLIEIPQFAEKADLFAFLKKNSAALIQQKKMMAKESFGLEFNGKLFDVKGAAIKASPSVASVSEILNVKAAMNTTNWLDSHLDVHFPGIWDRTLNNNKMLMHLQEHEMEFDKIIADGADLKASLKDMTWKELGYNYPGITQVLIFDSVVRKARNPYMFEQYGSGYVRNHSVLMIYVKMVLCINEPDSTDYGAEYEAWQKYFPQVVNQDFAEEMGYMWAILEAKLIEGSAVPRGSNVVTPTISVDSSKGTPKTDSLKGTPSIYKLNLDAPDKGLKVGALKINVNKL